MRITTLFIFISLIINQSNGQTRCDTISTDIFVYTEVPPMPDITYEQLEKILSSSIDITDYNAPVGNMIYLSFVINCKGEDFDYFMHQQVDSKLKDKLIQIIQSNMSWTPAKHGGKEVDFQKSISIKIEGNQFKILDQDNKKRKMKKKEK